MAGGDGYGGMDLIIFNMILMAFWDLDVCDLMRFQ
jgi:hypothetical protein